MSTILDSKRLITSIKRRGMIPSSQETFTDDDFLEIASEEININLMPQIIKAHEEHLIYDIDIPLVDGQRSYPMPSRAHGNKLRDVSLVFNAGENNEQVIELSRMSLEELSDVYTGSSSQRVTSFYIKNNEVYLTSSTVNQTAVLRMSFYLRPNKLVLNKRGCSIVSSTSETQIDTITPISLTATNISTGTTTVNITIANHGLESDKISISSSNSTPSIDGFYTYDVVDENTIQIEVASPVTIAGTSAVVETALDVTTYLVDLIPSHFTVDFLYDSVQHISPNKVLTYDMPCNKVDNTLNTISFPANLTSKISTKNYITIAEETIVPNIPTELHPILAQAVAVHCMEALGDEAGKQSAERKLTQMKDDAFTLLDNRVEGAPQKIRNRHSTLNQSVSSTFRRFRR